MRILIVEDERGKENNIINFIRDTFGNALVEVRHSVTTGIIAIRQNDFDYVLLDMSLPLFDFDDMKYSEGNEFETFGGNCKFRPSSHTCTYIQPRCHGISATPSRSGATVVRGAVTPLQPVNQALSQRAMIFLDCS